MHRKIKNNYFNKDDEVRNTRRSSKREHDPSLIGPRKCTSGLNSMEFMSNWVQLLFLSTLLALVFAVMTRLATRGKPQKGRVYLSRMHIRCCGLDKSTKGFRAESSSASGKP